jgi:hypothetical protein
MTYTLAIVSLAINAILFIWLIVITLKTMAYKASFKSASEALTQGKIPQLLENNSKMIEALDKKSEDLFSLDGKLNKKIEESYRNIGLVRFDAFTEVGGNLSFSIALMDDKKNGIIITSINGRQESRSFVKEVTEGKGNPQLSEEEEQAVEKALTERR